MAAGYFPSAPTVLHTRAPASSAEVVLSETQALGLDGAVIAGNTLTGSIPAITSPVLYLDLSNNMLDANLTASLQALPADAFSATLVLDLSGNKLFGALPPAATGPRSGLPNAWRNLLASAVRVDLSGGHGTVPGCTHAYGLEGQSTQSAETTWIA